MRFLSLEKPPFTPEDTIFRQPASSPLIATLLLLGAAVGVFVAGNADKLPGLIVALGGGALLLFSGVSAVMLRRALSPENWLLACNGRRALIKIRSHLNVNFPSEVPHVLEVPLSEVEAVRATTVRLQGQDSARSMLREHILFLDLQLQAGADLSELQARLQHERTLRSRGTAWRHYPVSVVNERILRLEWRGKHGRIVPRIERALQLLRGTAGMGQDATEHIEFGGAGRRLDETEALGQVRALAEQGRIIEATLLAKRAFGWSTTAAREYVEQLTEPQGKQVRDR